jgi:hypothetical protein
MITYASPEQLSNSRTADELWLTAWGLEIPFFRLTKVPLNSQKKTPVGLLFSEAQVMQILQGEFHEMRKVIHEIKSYLLT